MALDTYLEDSDKKRDANMQLHDSREILSSYMEAYNMGERVIKPEDIQTDDEIQQNSESHSQENLNIMKKVYGMR
jgi:hypothetical protein